MKRLFFNRALRILLATNALILMAGAMLAPIYALFVERIGGNLMDASIASAIFSFFAGITTLLSGKYSDKIPRKEHIIILGYSIMGFGFLSYVWVDSILQLFFVQALIGLGEAIYSPAFDAVYSEHLTIAKSGSQWGAWESMNYFVTTIGAFVGGLIVTAFGFQTLFILISILCFASSLYILRLKRRTL